MEGGSQDGEGQVLKLNFFLILIIMQIIIDISHNNYGCIYVIGTGHGGWISRWRRSGTKIEFFFILIIIPFRTY